MTAPYTLIAFHCFESDLKDQAGLPTRLGEILDSTKAHRVEIYLGAYVFDTRKDWQNIHRLCEFLRTRRRTFARLPFEGELHAVVAQSVAQALETQGVTLYQYPELEP